MVSLLHRATIN